MNKDVAVTRRHSNTIPLSAHPPHPSASANQAHLATNLDAVDAFLRFPRSKNCHYPKYQWRKQEHLRNRNKTDVKPWQSRHVLRTVFVSFLQTVVLLATAKTTSNFKSYLTKKILIPYLNKSWPRTSFLY